MEEKNSKVEFLIRIIVFPIDLIWILYYFFLLFSYSISNFLIKIPIKINIFLVINKYIKRLIIKDLNIKIKFLLKSKRETRAIELLRIKLFFEPENYENWKKIGETYEDINKMNKAILYYQKYLKLNKENEDICIKIFNYYIQNEQYEKAESIEISTGNDFLFFWSNFIFPLVVARGENRIDLDKFKNLFNLNYHGLCQFILNTESESKVVHLFYQIVIYVIINNKENEFLKIIDSLLNKFPNNKSILLVYSSLKFILNDFDTALQSHDRLLKEPSLKEEKLKDFISSTLNFFYGFCAFNTHQNNLGINYLELSNIKFPSKLANFILGQIYQIENRETLSLKHYNLVFEYQNNVPEIWPKLTKNEINNLLDEYNIKLGSVFEEVELKTIDLLISIYEKNKMHAELINLFRKILKKDFSDNFYYLVSFHIVRLSKNKLINFDFRNLYTELYNKFNKGNFKSELFAFSLLQNNYDLQEKARQAEKEKEEIEIKTKQILLSYLSHSFRNSLSNGPETIRETLNLAKKALEKDYEDKLAYKAFNNLAGLYSTFAMVENILDTFQLFVQDSGRFVEEWHKEIRGDKSVKYLFSLSVKQNISRFLFSEGLIQEREKLIPNFSSEKLRSLRKSFLEKILFVEFEELSPDLVLSWVKENLDFIKIEISDEITKFNKRGVHFLLNYSVVSESMFNALKYSSNEELIHISWKRENSTILFECKNRFSKESVKYSDSKSGLQFIEYLINKIQKDIRFTRESKKSEFKVTLKLTNIKGDLYENSLD